MTADTRYPILMLHGMGFRDYKHICYWGRIPELLRKNGARVYFGGQDSNGSIESNALQIEKRLKEVMEETGLIVIPSSIEPIGEITEIRKDVFEDNMKYVCHSFYYRCDVKDETVMATPSENEIAKGLRLEWAELDDIIAENRSLDLSSTRIRDTIFLEMVKAEAI